MTSSNIEPVWAHMTVNENETFNTYDNVIPQPDEITDITPPVTTIYKQQRIFNTK